MSLTFSNPENFEAIVKVAESMYEHVARAGLAGMAFADAASAIAIMEGIFLAGAYSDEAKQKIAAINLTKAALGYARQLKRAQRVPYDNLAPGGASN